MKQRYFTTPRQYFLLAWFFITTVVVILVMAVLLSTSAALAIIANLADSLRQILKNSVDPIIAFKDRISPQPCEIAGTCKEPN